MKLRSYPYTLELRHAFTIATASRTTTPAVIVEIEHEGITGYGEAAMPPYLGESQASAAAFLARVDLSQIADPFQLEEILPAIDAIAPGNTAAKAAVDIALHDWIGQKLGAPWYRIWGLDPAKAPVTSFTIGIDTPEIVRQKTREAAPYKIIKVKLGRDLATDRGLIDAIRDVTATPITVDANQGWRDRTEALRMIEWLATRGVVFIEQPMPKEQIDDTAWLRERSPLPLIADEECPAPRRCPPRRRRVRRHQYQAHEVHRSPRGAQDDHPRPRPRPQGHARLHDGNLLRHLRRRATLAARRLGRPRRRAADQKRPLRRHHHRRRQDHAARPPRSRPHQTLIRRSRFPSAMPVATPVSPTLREKIGQLLNVGFRGTTAADCELIARDIRELHLGGIILFDQDMAGGTIDSGPRRRNIESPAQVKALLAHLQLQAAIPLLTSIDQEGGRVNRLKPVYGFPPSISRRNSAVSTNPPRPTVTPPSPRKLSPASASI